MDKVLFVLLLLGAFHLVFFQGVSGALRSRGRGGDEAEDNRRLGSRSGMMM